LRAFRVNIRSLPPWRSATDPRREAAPLAPRGNAIDPCGNAIDPPREGVRWRHRLPLALVAATPGSCFDRRKGEIAAVGPLNQWRHPYVSQDEKARGQAR